jgi:hypothetical protein
MTRLVLIVMMAACAPKPDAPMYVTGAPGSMEQKPTTEDPNSGTVECHDEALTGSLISHTVCRTKETTQDRRNVDSFERSMETPKTVRTCGPPQC